MADHASSGLWDVHSYEMLYPSELGLSQEICNELKAWVSFYEKNCLDFSEDIVKPLDCKEFTEKGKAIAKAIKKEKPHLEVYVFDEEIFENKEKAKDWGTRQVDKHLRFLIKID